MAAPANECLDRVLFRGSIAAYLGQLVFLKVPCSIDLAVGKMGRPSGSRP